jgi:hypothetical protein
MVTLIPVCQPDYNQLVGRTSRSARGLQAPLPALVVAIGVTYESN